MSTLSVTSQSKTDATQYLWDINHGLPQVLTESGKKGTALYSYGLGRISMADPRKGPMYYQYDGLGSVRSLTDRKGMTKGLYAYDVFGNPLITASPVDNDFQYTGEQVDDETGLIYLRARYYDPGIGRFCQGDRGDVFHLETKSRLGNVKPLCVYGLVHEEGQGVGGGSHGYDRMGGICDGRGAGRKL